MDFRIRFSARAFKELSELEESPAKIGLVKQIKKTLAHLQNNPRHPGLNTHIFTALKHPYRTGDKVFEAYAQNNTPSAYRVFWCYGPHHGEITIIAITPHP